MRVRLIITKLPQPVVNTKACNFPLMLIVLLLLKVLTNAPVGVTVDNKILKILKSCEREGNKLCLQKRQDQSPAEFIECSS